MDFLGESVATESVATVNKTWPTGEKNVSEYFHDLVLLHSPIGLYNMFRFSDEYLYSKEFEG